MSCPCGCGHEFPALTVNIKSEAARRYVENWMVEVGTSLEELRGDGRRQLRLTPVRIQVIGYLREHGWSLSEIGAYLKRDHTSILRFANKYLDARQESE